MKKLSETQQILVAIQAQHISKEINDALNILKEASQHMNIWLQDEGNKDNYYIIKPSTVLGFFRKFKNNINTLKEVFYDKNIKGDLNYE
jgi:hypothetical protein